MVPFQALLAEATRVHAVCPDKKAGEQIRPPSTTSRVPRPTARSRGTISPQRQLCRSAAPGLRCLVLPGGRGPEYLRTYPAVVAAVRHFSNRQARGGHLPRGRSSGGRGRAPGLQLSAYPACRAEVELAGGRYADIAGGQGPHRRQPRDCPAWPAPGLDCAVPGRAGYAHHALSLRACPPCTPLYGRARWRLAFRSLEFPPCARSLSVPTRPLRLPRRSVRLRGATSIRLENLFWQVLKRLPRATAWACPSCAPGCCDELLADAAAWTTLRRFCGCAAGVIWRCSSRADLRDRSIPIRRDPSRCAGYRSTPARTGLGCTRHAGLRSGHAGVQLSTTELRRRR